MHRVRSLRISRARIQKYLAVLLVLPLLSVFPNHVARAADAQVKFRLTNAAVSETHTVVLFSKNTGTKSVLSIPASGILTANLADGQYYMRLIQSAGEAKLRAPSEFWLVVDSVGSSSSLLRTTISGNNLYSYTSISKNGSGEYPLELSTTGMRVSLIVGTEARDTDITSITTTNGLVKSTFVSVGDSGSVVSTIDAGTYLVKVTETSNSLHQGSKTCTVTTNAITDCVITLPADNARFKVLAANGDTLTADVKSDLTAQLSKVLDTGKVEWSTQIFGTDIAEFSLQNGNYQATIFKTTMDFKTGNGTTFNFTVANDVITGVTSAGTGASVPVINGVYQLRFTPSNFMARVTAGGAATSQVWAYGYNPTAGKNFNPRIDSAGNFELQLPNGTNYIFLRPAGESTSYVGTNYTVTVASGVVTEVKNAKLETLTAENEQFLLPLKPANVQGQLTIGGITSQGYVNSVIDRQTGNWLNVEASNVNSQGQFGLALAPGLYTIGVNPYYPNQGYGLPLTTTCEVKSGASATCDIVAPAKNFSFVVEDVNGNALVANARPTISNANPARFSTTLSNSQSANYSLSLQNGDYEFVASSTSPETDGLNKLYTFTVANNEITKVTNANTGAQILPVAGVFHLRLGSPNFQSVVRANGSADPFVYANTYQIRDTGARFNTLQATANADGVLKFDLPNGLNYVVINPTGNESPTVATATYRVLIDSGTVASVTNMSGETLTASASRYNLDFIIPNIVGTLTMNGVATGGYIQGIWNTVLNKSEDLSFPGIGSNGAYSLIVPAGNYDLMFVPWGAVGSVINCTATAGVSTRCDMALPAPNLNFAIKNYSGVKLTKGIFAGVTRTFEKGQSFGGKTYGFGVNANENGDFRVSLQDGSYTLNIESSDPLNDGARKSFGFTISSGKVGLFTDLDSREEVDSTTALSGLRLVAPNFKFIAKANGSANPYARIWGYSQSKGGSWFDAQTDSQGRGSTKLGDGQYQVTLNPGWSESQRSIYSNFTITVESQTVASVVDENGVALSPNANGFYELPLLAPNISGTITYGGVSHPELSSYPGFFIDKNTGSFVQAKSMGISSTEFISKVPAGNYYVNINANGRGSTFHSCNVTDATTNVCNFDLPLDNLNFKILGTNGDALFTDVGASLNLNSDSWGMSWGLTQQVGGIFKASLKLPSGFAATYSVIVYPNNGSNRFGVASTFKIEMSGESITSIANVATGETLTPDSAGIYGFKLSAPNIAGTVVAPNGTTPIPSTEVTIRGPIGMGAMTDNSGQFASYTNIDGSYVIYARAPESDLTKADSARTVVEVSNHVGTSGLILKLRTPTVRGTVTGPKGVSPWNWIQVLKKNSFGDYEYVGDEIVSGRPTTSEGKFALYLDPGIYRFQAQADDSQAGGGRTVSGDCVVTDTSTVVDCNFSLRSTNTLIKLLSRTGAAYVQANINYRYIGKVRETDSDPSSSWDYSYANKNSIFAATLDSGLWEAQVSPYGNGTESPITLNIRVETGTVTSVTDKKGVAYTPDASGVYSVQLPSANLVGTIKDSGKTINYGASVQIYQSGDTGQSNWQNKWTNNGAYSFSVDPGTYTIMVYPYGNGTFSSSATVPTTIESCVVADTGTSTCDVALERGNFLGKITTPAGVLIKQSWAYAYQVADSTGATAFKKFGMGINVRSGQFTHRFPDGTYRLGIQADPNSQYQYAPETFELVMESGTVHSLIRLSTRAQVVPDAQGFYSLSFVEPNIQGVVYKSGSGSTGVSWADVLPYSTSGEELWEFRTNTNSNGRFALTLPDGTYDLVARSWNGKDGAFMSSAKVRVTVSTASPISNLVIRLSEPNLRVRIVSPTNSAVGMPGVWVNGNFNGKYFWGSTDASGYFNAFVDTSTGTTCTGTCSISAYPDDTLHFAPSSETFTAIGTLPSLALGVVNSKVSVFIPTNGVNGIPDRWSWVAVQELNSSGDVINEMGAGTNEIGQAGLGLVAGHRYRLTAYPSGEYYGRYSPKSFEIASFDATTHAQITITFDSPNVTFIVLDNTNKANSWGWFEVSKKNGSNVYELTQDGYLNDQGRGALTLADGDYKILFHPGKAKGVDKTITITVSGGHVTSANDGSLFTNDIGTIVIGNGTVFGTVKNASGTLMPNLPITAKTASGTLQTVTTVTTEDGSYELNLDTTRDWIVSSIDPITMAKGSINIAATTGPFTNRLITIS